MTTITETNRVESWRKSLGMTQEQAARELRVALRTYQRWESGETRPRGQQRETLEAALAQAGGGQ